MKKTRVIIFILFAVLECTSLKAYAFMVDGLCYYLNSDNESVTITYNSEDYKYGHAYSNLTGHLIIPGSVIYNDKAYAVTAIGNSAFICCSGITSVTIPSSIITIDNFAFFFFFLISIIIPSSVTSIGKSAFQGSKLTSVIIPNNVTYIDSNAFNGCYDLASVTIGNGVTFIGETAFSHCYNLKTFTIEDGDSTLYMATGYNDTNKIFSNSPIEILYLGRNIEWANNWSPFQKSTLSSLTISNKVNNIGDGAFTGCSGLTSVTIPNSVTTIGSSAFSGCRGLTSVTIGNSVTSIGSRAFYGCQGLNSVIWNARSCSDFSSYDESPFYYTVGSQIKHFKFGEEVERIPAYLCRDKEGLTSVTIPNSVTEVGEYAFYGCRGLTSVTIGNSVTLIGRYAFTGSFESGDTIFSLNPTPPSLGHSVFYKGYFNGTSYFDYDATLLVPIGSKTTYQTSEGWKNFYNIEETEYDGIDNVVIDQLFDPFKNPGEIKTIYTIDGRALNPQDVSLLPNGIYIINGKKIVINR